MELSAPGSSRDSHGSGVGASILGARRITSLGSTRSGAASARRLGAGRDSVPPCTPRNPVSSQNRWKVRSVSIPRYRA
jgi:hypothetical protein